MAERRAAMRSAKTRFSQRWSQLMSGWSCHRLLRRGMMLGSSGMPPCSTAWCTASAAMRLGPCDADPVERKPAGHDGECEGEADAEAHRQARMGLEEHDGQRIEDGELDEQPAEDAA